MGESSKNRGLNDLPYDTSRSMRVAILSLSIVNVVQFVLLVGSCVIAVNLYTEKREPFPIFFTIDSVANQVVRIERGKGMTLAQSVLLRELAFKKYVENREIVNHSDEKLRYIEVKMMSSGEIWTHFREQMDVKKNKKSLLGDETFKREIEVTNSYQVKNVRNIWRVEFIVKDEFRGRKTPPRKISATIQYTESDEKIKVQDKYLNVFGVTVIGYQLHAM